MKRTALALVVVAAGLLGWHLWTPAGQGAAPSPTAPTVDLPDRVTTDPADVFSRAFWKRPGPGDTILHAERREWADEDGVTRWQWFLAVEPSPALAHHLLEKNTFGLAEVREPVSFADAGMPAWFPQDSSRFNLHRSADGRMSLLHDHETGRLFAMSAGGGFQRGAELVRNPVPLAATPSSGRLSASPPPSSSTP